MTATCDFCNGADATHALPCAAVGVRASGAYGTAHTTLVGAWHACDDCLPYIERADPDALADYVARAGHGPPEILRLTTTAFRRDVFRALYAHVLPLLGSPVPLARESARVSKLAQGGRKP